MPDINPEQVISHLGKCIWNARIRKKWSRRKLAEQSGYSERCIQLIEKGQSNMTCATLFRLVNILQIPVNCLFESNEPIEEEIKYVINALRRCSVEEQVFICKTTMSMIDNFNEFRR